LVAAARRLHDPGLPTPVAPGPLMLPPTASGAAAEARHVVTFERPPLRSLDPAGSVRATAALSTSSGTCVDGVDRQTKRSS
jgi:hypothetical protein